MTLEEAFKALNDLDKNKTGKLQEQLNEAADNKNITCPCCNSTNVVLVDENEWTDPYNKDNFFGEEHTISNNYRCKDCSCEFKYTQKEIRYSGMNIVRNGVKNIANVQNERWAKTLREVVSRVEENVFEPITKGKNVAGPNIQEQASKISKECLNILLEEPEKGYYRIDSIVDDYDYEEFDEYLEDNWNDSIYNYHNVGMYDYPHFEEFYELKHQLWDYEFRKIYKKLYDNYYTGKKYISNNELGQLIRKNLLDGWKQAGLPM